jgi:protein-tyrosine phosphatase
MKKTKILFVCLGNICRSPSAEAVMKALVEEQGLNDYFEIDSAGILDTHEGEPADARMQRHATLRGLNLTSKSRPVNPKYDFAHFDLIIGMDDQNISDLNRLAPDQASRQKIHKMTDFSQSGNYKNVPDPYFGGDLGFELVLDILDETCKGLLQHIQVE